MELEALLLGIEPLTALAVGVGALAVGGLISVSQSVTGTNVGESARNAAKTGLVWTMQAYDVVAGAAAEATESFQDLVADAKQEVNNSKRANEQNGPQEVELVSE